MGIWDERQTYKAVFDQTDRLSRLLEEVPAPATQEQADWLDRLRQCLAALESRRTGPASLAGDGVLNQVTSALGQVISSADTARANEDLAHLQPTMQYAENVLAVLGGWPVPQSGEAAAAQAAAEGYRRDAEALLACLKEKTDSLEAAVNAATQADAQRVQQADAALEGLSDRIEQESARVTEQSTRLDTLLTQTTAQAAEAEQARAQHASEALAKHEQDVQTKIAEIEQRAAAAQQADQAKAAEVLASLADLEKQAKNVVASTAKRVIAGDYGEWAEQQRVSAWWWNGAAVAAALAAFGFALVVAVAWHNDTNWHAVAYKIAGSVTLLALAGYAGGQATEHRREERLAKRTQLSLDALDPFLANFEPNEQRTIKDRLVDQFFAAPQQHERRHGTVKAETGTLADLAAALADIAKQLPAAK